MKLNQKLGPITMSMICAVAGLLLLLFPNTSVTTAVYAVACVAALAGVFQTISCLLHKTAKNDNLVRGLVFLSAGLYMAFRPDQIGTLLPTLLAFVVLASGCSLLQEALVRHWAKGAQILPIACMGAALVIWAVVLLINPFSNYFVLYRMTGLGLFATGIMQLVLHLWLKDKKAA